MYIVRQIFKLSIYTAVRGVIFYIGSKPCDILTDERRYLLLISSLKNDYETNRRCDALLEYEDDFRRIAIANGLNFLTCVCDIKRLFFYFTRVLCSFELIYCV